MKREKRVVICPQCGSADIGIDSSNAISIDVGILPKKCNRCGHTAITFPEVDIKNAKKMLIPLNKVKKREFVDKTVTKGEYSIYVYLIPIFFFLAGLFMIYYKINYGLLISIFGLVSFVYIYYNRKYLKKFD